MIRYRWARWEIGPWLLSLSLLVLHLDWAPLTMRSAGRLRPDGLICSLGLSMLLLVFDDYKMHMRRLGVVNALTTSITRAQQHGPIMATALEELKGLMRAKAAWFRLLEGDGWCIATADRPFSKTLSGTACRSRRTISSNAALRKRADGD